MPEQTRIELVQYDSAPGLELHVVRQHPTAGPTVVNLASAAATWNMRLQGASPGGLVTRGATVLDGTAGRAFVPFTGGTGGDLASAGQYLGQLTIRFADGTTQTAPPAEPFLVVVKARV